MKLQYFTYFLNQVDQSSLFLERKNVDDDLLDILKNKIVFKNKRGSEFVYVFDNEKGDYIIGKIGKRSEVKKNLPPEKKFKKTIDETWPFTFVIFNLSKDKSKGQKIVFEHKRDVFTSPNAGLNLLVEEVNKKLMTSGWLMAVNPVTEEKDFWDSIKKNEGKIIKLILKLNTPNLFNLKNELNSDLKKLNKEQGANKLTIGLENPTGKLKIKENEFNKQAIDYISKGGGSYQINVKAKTLKKMTRIKSKDIVKTKVFNDLEIHLSAENQQELFSSLDKIFE